MAATETKVEEQIEPLMCKSYALKVSIHCEGCKRKVKKILQSIDGVYSINIDLRKQKVMVMGNIDSKTLIKKLTKAGKNAELWPEKSDSKKKKRGKSEKKEKQSDPEGREDSSQVSDEDEKEGVKVVVQDTAKNGEGGIPNKNSEGCGCAAGKSGVQFQAPRPELKQVVTISAGNQPPTPGCNENEARDDGSGGGSKKKKKKKKKGQKGNNSGAKGGERSGDAAANQAQVQVLEAVSNIPSQANQNPPGHHIGHQYPPHYHYAPPVYGVNHHTAYVNSYSTEYYNSKGSYAHMPPLYDSEPYTLQPSDSFAFLSDENPNGCAVM